MVGGGAYTGFTERDRGGDGEAITELMAGHPCQKAGATHSRHGLRAFRPLFRAGSCCEPPLDLFTRVQHLLDAETSSPGLKSRPRRRLRLRSSEVMPRQGDPSSNMTRVARRRDQPRLVQGGLDGFGPSLTTTP